MTTQLPTPQRIVVIGAGIVGTATALLLTNDGHNVTLLDPGPPGGEQSASYGNGTILNPASVVPMSTPGVWRKVPGYLMDPQGPLTIRWRHLPRLLPWLTRFLRAGSTLQKVQRTASALAALLHDAPRLHLALAEQADVPHLIQRTGLLYPYTSRAAFQADALAWQPRRDNGLTWQELDEDALRQQEPALDRRYTFAILAPQAGNITDPGAYIAALAAQARAQGATILQATATGFRLDHGRLQAVTTPTIELPCDTAILAAGAHAARLARQLGDTIPLEAERGYHITVTHPGLELRHPILTTDTKVAVVNTAAGLRIAGTVELAGLDALPTWSRAQALRAILQRTLPALAHDLPDDRIKVWMGNRPSTPDGLPVIGPSPNCPAVIHAFGHGHVGLAAGARTAHLVADLVAGRPPTIDPTPYAPDRFTQRQAPRPRQAP